MVSEDGYIVQMRKVRNLVYGFRVVVEAVSFRTVLEHPNHLEDCHFKQASRVVW